tara:strand:+ start:20244 stop:21224 length:981 start_codon:yes stop_codon:yes gene_type:complete
MNTIFRNLFSRNKNKSSSVRGDFRILEESDQIRGEYKDWSLTHAGFDKIVFNGRGEKVAVIDTGVDASHKDLKEQIDGAYTFLTSTSDVTDRNGHGTFCMGQILAKENGTGVVGVAPEAKGISYKVFKGSSSSDHKEFVNALVSSIYDAVAKDCGVISMSLGMRKEKEVLEALQYAVSKGVIPIAAAGNDGMKGSLWNSYPAAYEEVISVSSANSKDMPAFWSSFGRGNNRLEQPEISIASLEYYWGCIPGSFYGKMVGTSMSCPMVSGSALLWRESMRSKGLLPSGSEILTQYREWLYRVADDTNNNGWDAELGYGVLLLEDGEL